MKTLIIDESEEASSRLRDALSEEGYLVEVANTGGEALWLLGAGGIDLVLLYSPALDERMVEFVRAVRQEGYDVPVMMLVEEASASTRIAALDAGADDVIVSPVTFNEIAARLRALARRPAELESLDLHLGTLELDVASRTAYRHCDTRPVVVELTAREYSVLELMMRHPRTVLTRTRLMEHVWGTGAHESSNVVDQLVSRLRAKIDRPFGLRDIVTVRGIGYRFDPAHAGRTAS